MSTYMHTPNLFDHIQAFHMSFNVSCFIHNPNASLFSLQSDIETESLSISEIIEKLVLIHRQTLVFGIHLSQNWCFEYVNINVHMHYMHCMMTVIMYGLK